MDEDFCAKDFIETVTLSNCFDVTHVKQEAVSLLTCTVTLDGAI